MLKRVVKIKFKGKNLIAKLKITAIKKLDKGPAMETLSVPHFWSRKLYGLIGTGFVQPKIGPFPAVNKNKKKGTRTEPNGSKCFNGLRVRRPACFAVGSPK